MTSILETEKHAYRSFVKHCFDSQPIEENNTLEGLLKSIFPISTKDNIYTLDYVGYDLHTYGPDGEEFLISEFSSEVFFYKAPPKYIGFVGETDAGLDLSVIIQKVIWETPITDDSKIQDIIQQNVILGPLPRMTINGTFIDHGIEKRYVGEGLAVDHLAQVVAQALSSINSLVQKNFKEMDMREVFPFDLVETSPLERKTRQFLDELVPVTLN